MDTYIKLMLHLHGGGGEEKVIYTGCLNTYVTNFSSIFPTPK